MKTILITILIISTLAASSQSKYVSTIEKPGRGTLVAAAVVYLLTANVAVQQSFQKEQSQDRFKVINAGMFVSGALLVTASIQINRENHVRSRPRKEL